MINEIEKDIFRIFRKQCGFLKFENGIVCGHPQNTNKNGLCRIQTCPIQKKTMSLEVF